MVSKIDVISDKNGHNWIIPESPEKLAVEEEQIVKRNLWDFMQNRTEQSNSLRNIKQSGRSAKK